MLTLATADPQLVITQLVEADAGEHFAVIDGSREHLARWLPWVESTGGERAVASFIAVSMAAWQGRQQLACALRRDGRIIGGIGIVALDQDNEVASLGYWLGRNHCGHGYMSLGVAALIEHCFSALAVHRVQIRAAVQNMASRRVAERLGFTLEGIERGATKLAGGYQDMAMYALLREDRRLPGLAVAG
jgi:ribosomal-protein-serine acetyltransferase